MKSTVRVLVLCVLGLFVAAVGAAAEDYTVFESKKYGYALKIPNEFKLDGKEDKTTTWLYQPGAAPATENAAPAAPEEKKKKKGLGGLARGVADSIGGGAESKTETGTPPASQELEPALTIYINWVWMPDVATSTLFDANKKSDLQDINSPDPTYTDLVVMDKKSGYAIGDGAAYRYKEKNKTDPAEIHRWHIKAFGNKSSYTIGLCGTYGQFEKWGPVYEEVIKSFKLIPLEGNN